MNPVLPEYYTNNSTDTIDSATKSLSLFVCVCVRVCLFMCV
jgi:hypothetical protein